MNDLELQFDEAMMDVYRTAKSDCNYNATDFLQMLHRDRGLQTAKRLLASDGAQYGFTKLWECGRLDITVECLVLNKRFQGLFTEDELESARQRLRQYNFDPAKCEC
jgi:lactam utilization protein B